MTKDQFKSLQDRLVKEINNTYNSITEYKKYAKSNALHNKIADITTAEKRIQIVEGKLKALKITLAKIDNGNLYECIKCKKPIAPKNPLLKRPINQFCEDCLTE